MVVKPLFIIDKLFISNRDIPH